MATLCPQCGALIEETASACPDCGSCKETGWSERAQYDSLGTDYDEEEFDYEKFVEEEFGAPKPAARFDLSRRGWIAIGLIFLFLSLLLANWFF